MLIVKSVIKYSDAWKKGLRTGDRIFKINGEEAVDTLDLLFITDDEFRVEVEGKGILEIFGDGDTGFDVEDFQVRKCANNCIFCFVSQLPGGLRRSLYVKDDDYRLSFLYGSYITLTNMSDKDFKRIKRLHLSPLYVSVHAIDDGLRESLMNCPGKRDIRGSIERLTDSGIQLHTQIVIVPGVNDGKVLEETVEYLEGLHPLVRSITLVPVGITSHREGLSGIRKLTRGEASEILAFLARRVSDEVEKTGEKVLYATDEMYITAGRMPPMEQVPELIDNGVGMYGKLMSELEEITPRELSECDRDLNVCMITSVDGGIIMGEAVRILSGYVKRLDICTVKNDFFGNLVTVTGLLSGKDIMKKIKEKSGEYDRILVPDIIFNEDGLTLDGMTARQIEQSHDSVVITESDVAGLLKGLK